MRPQVPFPPDIDFGCFASQCCRPIEFSQELHFPALPLGVPGASDRAAFVRNEMVDQLCHLETMFLRGSTAIFLPMQASSRA